MTQEALKLALDALENHTAIKHPQQIHYRDKAIAAIKETLAQPEQKPVKMVAYNCTCGRTMKFESEHGVIAPQRTWLWLTDEEIDSYFEDHGWSPSEDYYPVIKAIEAKLKQKNGYAEEENT